MILDAPATEAPLGEDHNLENPPNNDTLVVAAVAICVAFSALFTLVRIYTRIWSPKVVAVSDGTFLDFHLLELILTQELVHVSRTSWLTLHRYTAFGIAAFVCIIDISMLSLALIVYANMRR